MNRLIILGNGFDLAHGLKTNFSDFNKYYWSKVRTFNHMSEFVNLRSYQNQHIPECSSFDELLNQLKHIWGFEPQLEIEGDVAKYVWQQNNHVFLTMTLHNNLFHDLFSTEQSLFWSDIEALYYKQLKEISTRTGEFRDLEDEEESIAEVKKLNKDIKHFTSVFSSYLESEIEPLINERLKIKNLDDHFRNTYFHSVTEVENFLKEFSLEYKKQIDTKNLADGYNVGDFTKGRFADSLILNFNYTNTINIYKNWHDRIFTEIKIHGTVGDEKNPILLGFGDEKDKYYEELESLNHNSYLEFMKSSHYAHNGNYRRLFEMIESSEFQVQIMGHSCGLSDRTLLNSIFQHHNCKSIKVFYYNYEEIDEYGETDNYSQIFRNISRHFSDKPRMRDKIVNKELCYRLSQRK